MPFAQQSPHYQRCRNLAFFKHVRVAPEYCQERNNDSTVRSNIRSFSPERTNDTLEDLTGCSSRERHTEGIKQITAGDPIVRLAGFDEVGCHFHTTKPVSYSSCFGELNNRVHP